MKLEKNLLIQAKRKGLTVAELARLSGVKQSTLYGWTTGRSVKNIDDLKRVCVVLEVGLHSLLYGEKDPFEQEEKHSIQEWLTSDLKITIERIKK